MIALWKENYVTVMKKIFWRTWNSFTCFHDFRNISSLRIVGLTFDSFRACLFSCFQGFFLAAIFVGLSLSKRLFNANKMKPFFWRSAFVLRDEAKDMYSGSCLPFSRSFFVWTIAANRAVNTECSARSNCTLHLKSCGFNLSSPIFHCKLSGSYIGRDTRHLNPA